MLLFCLKRVSSGELLSFVLDLVLIIVCVMRKDRKWYYNEYNTSEIQRYRPSVS